MIIKEDFGSLGVFSIELAKLEPKQYTAIYEYLASNVNDRKRKSREVIADAFIHSLQIAPEENPSDLWHHVIYRVYIAEKVGTNPNQSWVRTSGEAFELAIETLYNPVLKSRGFELKSLIGKKDKLEYLREVGLENLIGSSKVDVSIISYKDGKPRIIGGIHCKTSLAERVSDDIPASRIMMNKGLLSILLTLDIKSFPPPYGDLVNRGELGAPDTPSDKRNYIEIHGDFDACFSLNTRTKPSKTETRSGKKIYVIKPGIAPDAFVDFLTRQS
jgi:hypothetical protein